MGLLTAPSAARLVPSTAKVATIAVAAAGFHMMWARFHHDFALIAKIAFYYVMSTG